MSPLVLFTLMLVAFNVNDGLRCFTEVQSKARRILKNKYLKFPNKGTNKTSWRKNMKALIATKDFNPVTHRSWNLVYNEDCGISASDRIVGGTNADLGQYPWIARIGYSSKERPNEKPIFKCGGTLISEYYIITAAHCVANLPEKLYVSTVRLGEYNVDTDIDCKEDICANGVEDYETQNIFIHANYVDAQNGNDIALIRLKRFVEFTEWISPICLPYGYLLNKSFYNESVEVAGWGFYELGLPKGSTILQTVKLPVLNFSSCEKAFRTVNISKTEQICVGGEVGKDSCSGDSGGPLMKVQGLSGTPRYYLLGIVSFGSKYCGMATTPAVYTRISSYIKWILDNIKKYK